MQIQEKKPHVIDVRCSDRDRFRVVCRRGDTKMVEGPNPWKVTIAITDHWLQCTPPEKDPRQAVHPCPKSMLAHVVVPALINDPKAKPVHHLHLR